MPTLTLKISPEEASKLSRAAFQRGQSKSAYVRSLLADRIETTDDLLRAWEEGQIPTLRAKARRPNASP
jgi:hypothetical protein